MQIMPSTADYIAHKSGGTRVRAGRPRDSADQHRLRLLVPALPARALPRQRAARARRLQRRRGQGRPVVAGRRPTAASTSAWPTTSRSPRPASTSGKVLERAPRLPARVPGGSWGCERPPDERSAGPAWRCPRSATARGGSAASMWLGAQDDESLPALNRAIDLGVTFIDTALAYGDGHSEKLVGQVVARARRGDRRRDQDPAEEPRLAGAGRHRPRRGVPRRPRPQVHRAQPAQPRPRHDRPAAVPRVVGRVGRPRRAGSRGSRRSRPRARSASSASRSTTTSPRTR